MIIFGRNSILEALKSKTQIEKIFIQFGVRGDVIEKIKFLSKQNKILISEISSDRFVKLVDDKNSQGICAIISEIKYVDTETILSIAKNKNENPFILILDEILDPQNFGSIIRTAECFGVHGIIIPKHNSAIISSTVVKISSGAIYHIPIAKVTNIVSEIKKLKENGLWIFGTSLDANKFVHEEKFDCGVAIIFGNEGRGIRKLVQENCDFLVKIPLFGKIQSLNVTTSSSIVLYEISKQIKQKPI